MHLAIPFPLPGPHHPKGQFAAWWQPLVLSCLNVKKISCGLEGRNILFLHSVERPPIPAPAHNLSLLLLPGASAGLTPGCLAL